MTWDRTLWGVEFSSPLGYAFLIGTSWMYPRPTSQYEGEPTRALLFCTREQAREWCRNKVSEIKNRNDSCKKWRFRPVKVTETVRKEDQSK